MQIPLLSPILAARRMADEIAGQLIAEHGGTAAYRQARDAGRAGAVLVAE